MIKKLALAADARRERQDRERTTLAEEVEALKKAVCELQALFEDDGK